MRACIYCAAPVVALGLCQAHYARLKRGRPMEPPLRDGELIKIDVRFPAELIAAIDAHAIAERISRGAVIRRAAREWLDLKT